MSQLHPWTLSHHHHSLPCVSIATGTNNESHAKTQKKREGVDVSFVCTVISISHSSSWIYTSQITKINASLFNWWIRTLCCVSGGGSLQTYSVWLTVSAFLKHNQLLSVREEKENKSKRISYVNCGLHLFSYHVIQCYTMVLHTFLWDREQILIERECRCGTSEVIRLSDYICSLLPWELKSLSFSLCLVFSVGKWWDTCAWWRTTPTTRLSVRCFFGPLTAPRFTYCWNVETKGHLHFSDIL